MASRLDRVVGVLHIGPMRRTRMSEERLYLSNSSGRRRAQTPGAALPSSHASTEPRWWTSSSHRPARHLAARVATAVGDRGGRLRGGPWLRRLVDPRLEGDRGVGHASRPRSRHGVHRPVHGPAHHVAPVRHRRPDQSRALRARAAADRQGAPRPTLASTGIADAAPTSAPRPSSSSSTTSAIEIGPNHAFYEVDSSEGYWNSGTPGLGYTIREKHGYFLRPRTTPFMDTCVPRWC